jgi:hypothetical protein
LVDHVDGVFNVEAALEVDGRAAQQGSLRDETGGVR